jgi:hypothetical protein
MFARVVRFTDIDADQIARIDTEAESGPPEGVPAKSIKMMVDEDQKTAVVAIFFDSEDDMKKGAEVLDAMPADETPGKRASVDLCEVKMEMDA